MALPDDPENLDDQLQQLIWLETVASHNQLSPEDVTAYQKLQDKLNGANPNDVASAYNRLPDGQKKALSTLATVANQNTNGAPQPGKDGTYTPEQVAQLLNNALNTGGGGGNLNINEQTQARTRGQSIQGQTAVNYQDLPTPQEFLDNWDNSFSAHLEGLVQTGGITQEVANFARSNVGQFYGDYVRAQIKDALRGKPMFKVVGLNPDAKLLGARQGAYEYGSSAENQQTQYNLQQQTEGGGGGTSAAGLSSIFRSTPGPNIGIGAQVRGAEAAGGGGGSTLNLNDVGTTDTENQQLQTTREAIVQRNKLGVVANLAPLDFLKSGVDAQRLNMLYAGQKGTEQRARETASGEAAAAPARRIA